MPRNDYRKSLLLKSLDECGFLAKMMGSMKQKIQENKKKLRDSLKKKLRHQSEENRFKNCKIIDGLVHDLTAYRKASVVMFYLSMEEEVDTREIIKHALSENKTVILPVVQLGEETLLPVQLHDLDHLKPGKYGILEPKEWDSVFPIEKLDLVFVPGVAFDRKNHRLGRGKGYYDRFLSQLNHHVMKVGLAYDFQLVGELPVEEHDLQMDLVIHN